MNLPDINPILPGFNPDPSIVRVNDDYYIAVSTFEWYPGVQIYHSTDLVNWTLVHRPLNRADLLDMTGVPDSCGIWAPCLTHNNGKFYLIYTNVKRFDGNFKDSPNYLTTCETIDGEWTRPVYLNSSGFDPSLFHDDDGKKWLLNMVWDYRPDRSFFGGIALQQYCDKTERLIGESKIIFTGTEFGLTEGPHLYKKNGYYYLLTAEGGTGYEHVCTMARSKHIDGPYDVDPQGPIVATVPHLQHKLQRNGHGSLVESKEGEWYLAHLTSRPLDIEQPTSQRRSPMGRETAIESVQYTDDGWFRLATNSSQAQLNPIGLTAKPQRDFSFRDEFTDRFIADQFQWLRSPTPENFVSTTCKPGSLLLTGMHSLGSTFEQALVATRQRHFSFVAQTKIMFESNHFQQTAGLICYYNAHKFHYLYLSYDEKIGLNLDIMSCEGEQSLDLVFPIFEQRIPLLQSSVYLRADVHYETLKFEYSLNGSDWFHIASLDYSLISDEAGKGEGSSFTGAFVGLCAQDLTGQNTVAEFSYFDYKERHQ
ncbi:glycoside hydrolase family 43 protein [Shewanella japonica]|uniref:glycoside hydrolase family 43 protein n=1 Tax=Shewanella japonica TaxID=93973 RepID=UPI002494F31D|nr:glycoside hydrolase family 43 protein [Shewanella japonica]